MSNFGMIVWLLAIIIYFVIFDCFLLEAFSFLIRIKHGVDAEKRISWEEKGSVGRGEPITRIYYVKKKNLFSRKGKKEKKKQLAIGFILQRLLFFYNNL